MTSTAAGRAAPALDAHLEAALTERGYADIHYRDGRLRARTPCSQCRGVGTIKPGTEAERRCVFCRGTGRSRTPRAIDAAAILDPSSRPRKPAPQRQRPPVRMPEETDSRLSRGGAKRWRSYDERARAITIYLQGRRAGRQSPKWYTDPRTLAEALTAHHRRHAGARDSASGSCACIAHTRFLHPRIHNTALAVVTGGRAMTAKQNEHLERYRFAARSVFADNYDTNTLHDISRQRHPEAWAEADRIHQYHGALPAGGARTAQPGIDAARTAIAVAAVRHKLPLTEAHVDILLGNPPCPAGPPAEPLPVLYRLRLHRGGVPHAGNHRRFLERDDPR